MFRFALAFIAAGLCAGARPAVADDWVHPFFRHDVLLQGGAAFINIDSFAKVGAEHRPGTYLPLEDDLGLSSNQTAFDALARVRLFDRWMIEGAYFTVPRTASVNFAREIDFGHYTFDVSGGVEGKMDLASYRLALGYTFYKVPNAEVGVAASVYVSDYTAQLAGHVTVNGSTAGYKTETYDAPAPMPAIGLYANYALSPRWLLTGRVDYIDFDLSTTRWFGAELQDVGGHIVAIEATAEYRIFDNVGLGAGYRYMDVAIDADSEGLHGEVGYKLSMPTAFVRVDF